MTDKQETPKTRPRRFFVVLSLILPGLGQLFRGRVISAFLFLANVALYIVPVFTKQEMGYDIQAPSLLIAFIVWIMGAMDAFLEKSSFLVLALLVSLFCFGAGFLGAYLILPHLDV
jgi:hypothetical protein